MKYYLALLSISFLLFGSCKTASVPNDPSNADCGRSWALSNPDSRLESISGSWGIASDGSVWRWENDDWVQRNPGDKLAVISGTWGIAFDQSVWHWENNDWVQRNPGDKLAAISGSWGIATDGSVWRWERNEWTRRNPVDKLIDVHAGAGGWGIAIDGSVWHWERNEWTKVRFPEQVKARRISSTQTSQRNVCRVFVLDETNRVWSTFCDCSGSF